MKGQSKRSHSRFPFEPALNSNGARSALAVRLRRSVTAAEGFTGSARALRSAARSLFAFRGRLGAAAPLIVHADA